MPGLVWAGDFVGGDAGRASFLAGFFVGGTGTGLIAVAAGMYPTAIRSTGIGWAMGMGRVGQFRADADRYSGRPRLQGGGIFYAAAVPCFVGALFLILLMLARPTLQADAAVIAAPAE